MNSEDAILQLQHDVQLLKEQYQKKHQHIEALDHSIRENDQIIKQLVQKEQFLQKAYISFVQYILNTQRCLSTDRHPLSGTGVLLDREE